MNGNKDKKEPEAKVDTEVTDASRKEDIAELLGIDEKKESEGEDNKVDKAPEIKPEGVQGEGATEKKVESEGKEAPEDKKEGAEKDKQDEQVPNLVAELSRLSGLLAKQQENIYDIVPKEEEKKEEPKKEEEKTVVKEEQRAKDMLKPIPAETLSFIKDTDFQGTLDEKDRETLQNILTNVVAVTRKQTIQDIMSFMPRLINYNIQGAIAAQEFWSTNPALKALADKQPGIRQYVYFRANEIQKNNPQMHFGAIYSQVQKEVTAMLKQQLGEGDSQETSVNKGGKPGLARKPGAQRGDSKSSKSQLTDIQKEIVELMER